MINSVGLSSQTVNLLTQSNENTRNACVCELNGNHIPNSSQREFIKMVVEHYEKAESKVKRDEIAVEIKAFMNDVSKMRNDVFEVVNENTDHIFGRLKANCTEVDRDRYIQKLNTIFELNDEIGKSKEYKGFANGEVDKALWLHHSSSLYGDLESLAAVREGEREQVPALTYNKSSIQFG